MKLLIGFPPAKDKLLTEIPDQDYGYKIAAQRCAKYDFGLLKKP